MKDKVLISKIKITNLAVAMRNLWQFATPLPLHLSNNRSYILPIKWHSMTMTSLIALLHSKRQFYKTSSKLVHTITTNWPQLSWVMISSNPRFSSLVSVKQWWNKACWKSLYVQLTVPNKTSSAPNLSYSKPRLSPKTSTLAQNSITCLRSTWLQLKSWRCVECNTWSSQAFKYLRLHPQINISTISTSGYSNSSQVKLWHVKGNLGRLPLHRAAM